MCEKRARKIMKKSSQATRLREARRLERLQRLTITTPPALPPTEDRAPCLPHPIKFMDKTLQNKVLLELAWKTVFLMQKNRVIQQKIVDLQKETSEYVAKVMSHPDNKQQYSDHIRLYTFGVGVFQQKPIGVKSSLHKMEPDV